MKIEKENKLEYFAVGHEMKNGKYAVTFPDFPDLGAVVEKEEEVQEMAIKLLSRKLNQLSSLPSPKTKLEIMEELDSGSFCLALQVTANENTVAQEHSSTASIQEKDLEAVPQEEEEEQLGEENLQSEKEELLEEEKFSEESLSENAVQGNRREQAMALRAKLEKEGIVAPHEKWQHSLLEEEPRLSSEGGKTVKEEKASLEESVKKISQEAFKATENMGEKLAELSPEKISEEKSYLIGIVSSFLYVLGAFLPIVGIDTFFAKAKIYFFSALLAKRGFLYEIPNIRWTIFGIRTLGFLILFAGIFAVCSHLKKHSFYAVSAAAICSGLFLFGFLFLFIKISSFGMFSSAIAMSWAWFFLFLGSVGQIFSVFPAMKKLFEKKEEK